MIGVISIAQCDLLARVSASGAGGFGYQVLACEEEDLDLFLDLGLVVRDGTRMAITAKGRDCVSAMALRD